MLVAFILEGIELLFGPIAGGRHPDHEVATAGRVTLGFNRERVPPAVVDPGFHVSQWFVVGCIVDSLAVGIIFNVTFFIELVEVDPEITALDLQGYLLACFDGLDVLLFHRHFRIEAGNLRQVGPDSPGIVRDYGVDNIGFASLRDSVFFTDIVGIARAVETQIVNRRVPTVRYTHTTVPGHQGVFVIEQLGFQELRLLGYTEPHDPVDQVIIGFGSIFEGPVGGGNNDRVRFTVVGADIIEPDVSFDGEVEGETPALVGSDQLHGGPGMLRETFLENDPDIRIFRSLDTDTAGIIGAGIVMVGFDRQRQSLEHQVLR